MVCSNSPLAASAGLQVFQNGGNAFDAALAVAAVETVTLPPLCGLGGDSFILLHEGSSGRVTGINSSGGAASGATGDYYRSQGYRTMPLDGPHAASAPGEVAAWEQVHQRFCTRPFPDLLGPAISYAENGFPLSPRISRDFAGSAAKLAQFPSSAAVLLPAGRPPGEGETLVNQDLASSLRMVAQGGAQEFYRGALARRMVAGLRAGGGLFTEEDFANHRAEVYDPISVSYRGHTVYQTRPPSQGFLLLEMLNLVEGFDLRSLGEAGGTDLAQAVHLMVEAKKIAYADRNRLAGDPWMVEWPLEEVISKEYAARRRGEIDPVKASVPSQRQPVEVEGDTTYFCVADGQGNAVSWVHSLSNAFGSGFVAEGTGVVFNNRAGRGFSLESGHPNEIQPGKRTMHTLNCYLTTKDGLPAIVGGTPGGDFQPQCGLQILTNLLDFSMGPQEAVEAPRWWSFPGTDPASLDTPMELRAEPGMPEETVRGLEALGHKVARRRPGVYDGKVQLILFDHDKNVLAGASDPRGDGQAAAW
jgi:gamma-glutamyltranspeptidase/glutathione hydrolase